MEASVVRLGSRVADPALFARGLVFGTPIVEQIRCLSGAEPEHLVRRLTDALIRQLGLPARLLELQAIVVEARKSGRRRSAR